MDDGEGLFERVVFAGLFGGPIETFDLRLEKAARLPRTGHSQEADPPTSALEGADRRIARRVSCQESVPRAAERSKTGPTCSGDTRDFGINSLATLGARYGTRSNSWTHGNWMSWLGCAGRSQDWPDQVQRRHGEDRRNPAYTGHSWTWLPREPCCLCFSSRNPVEGRPIRELSDP